MAEILGSSATSGNGAGENRSLSKSLSHPVAPAGRHSAYAHNSPELWANAQELPYCQVISNLALARLNEMIPSPRPVLFKSERLGPGAGSQPLARLATLGGGGSAR